MPYLGRIPAALPLDGSELADGTISNAKLATGIAASKLTGALPFADSIIPGTNDAFDIGSAENKVRDMYISDDSLWIGDDHKVSITGGKMKFKKRKKTLVPSLITSAGGNQGGALSFSGKGSLSAMTTHDWLGYGRTMNANAKISDIFADDDFDSETASGVTAATYGSSSAIPIITVDEDGKVTTITTTAPSKSSIESLGIDLPAANLTGNVASARLTSVPSGNLTGTVAAARLSTATTQAESDDSTKIATTAYVTDKITSVIGGAPGTLNTLNELAAAINDDTNYNSTLTTSLATKLPLSGGTMTGNIIHNDNVKATFGNAGDLEIYHSGTASFIKENGPGELYIRGTNIILKSGTDNDDYIKCHENGDVILYYSNSQKLATTTSGISVTGNAIISGEVHSASDIALKENIEPITNAINKLKEISGVTFNKIGDKIRSTGILAQDVERVLPEAVRDGQFKSVAYGNMVGLLIEAIKEQQTQIDDLKQEIQNGK